MVSIQNQKQNQPTLDQKFQYFFLNVFFFRSLKSLCLLRLIFEVKKLFLNFFGTSLFLIFLSLTHVNADEMFNKGKEVFLGAGNCAACHMLSDAGSNAMVGPNLNEIRPDIQRIIMAVRNGIGVMPAMEGILTDEEIEAVAHYTSIAAEQ